MENRRVYSLEKLNTMDKEETARLILALQDEAAQSLFALEDTTMRYSELVREKDARIARLEEENAALSEENEILKAALGDRKAIIRVRNHDRYGRGTENLKVLLSGILPGMNEKEKAGILDQLEKLLHDKSIQDDPAGAAAADSQDNSHEPEEPDTPDETVSGPDCQDSSGEPGKSNHAWVSDGCQKHVQPEGFSMPSYTRQNAQKNNSGSRDRGHPPGIAATA